MKIGSTVQVVRGEHKGKQATLRGTEGYYCHLQLLTKSGRKQAHGLVSVHYSAIAPLSTALESSQRS
jgi:hypothetical protein